MDQQNGVNITDNETSSKLSHKLSELELREKERRVEEQARQSNLAYINLDKFPISQDALKIISRDQAESLQTICFLYTGAEMRLASTTPSNPQVTKVAKELGEKYNVNVKIYLISERSFDIAFAIYEQLPVITQFEGVKLSEEDLSKFDNQLSDFRDLSKLLEKTSTTEMLNLVISAALKFEASDVHIEAEVGDIKVRFRIDGVLHDMATIPTEAWKKINSRIKLLASLKLNIGDKPQDGRFSISLSKDSIDVRVSVVPSSYGESIVMRLLRASAVGLEFEALGMRGKSYNDLKEQMGKPNGMIISTGPTGSGKTTTLYAILNKLNKPERKIITLENPIEYKLPGIVQSQVEGSDEQLEDEERQKSEKKTFYTFAKGLRAILRQDPDIVMVGEIRDLETAETAINAALTGHLMLTTMHTNSAAGTIPRLLAMKVQNYLLAPAINAIIGQRLLRRLCQKCKVENTDIDNNTMTEVLNALKEIDARSGHQVTDTSNLKFYRSPGCSECHNLGYRGRVGIFEVLTMTPQIEKMILSGSVSEYEIQKTAVADGMITMFQDGVIKAMDGITSLEEVFREAKD